MKVLSILLLVFTGTAQALAADDAVFTVGIKATPPFTIKNDDGQWEGPTVWLIEGILNEMGKTPQFKEMDLTEIFTSLENGTIDAAIAALSITSAREEKVDFTHSYFESGIGVAIHDSKAEMWELALRNIFSLRFLQVVFSLLLLLTVIGLLVWLAERRHNAEEFGGRPAEGIGNGLWWSAVTMTTVGYGDKAPRTFMGRALGLAWMFLATIIIGGFTAGFASSLTRDSLAQKVENVQDLAKVKTATLKDSTSAAWLTSLKIPFRTSDSLKDLLKNLEAGKFGAVVYDRPVLEYYVSRDDLQKVDILKNTFTRENYGIALPQNAPYREQMDVILLRLTQSPAWEDEIYKVLNR